MAIDPPNLVYYREVEGRWICPFDLKIIDRPAFWGDVQRWTDRFQLLTLATLPGIIGSLILETSVDCRTTRETNEVVHTTRLTKWGMTLFQSKEVITLDPNGRDFIMQVPIRIGKGVSRGTVNESGTVASYEFPFFGTVMRQTGHREGEVTRIVQETSFSRGVQRLNRVLS